MAKMSNALSEPKIPLGFGSYPPRAFPKRTNSVHKMLGSKQSLKILLFLYSDFLENPGQTAAKIFRACKLHPNDAQWCIRKLRKEHLIIRLAPSVSSETARYRLSATGIRLLARVFAKQSNALRSKPQAILAHSKMLIHLCNKRGSPFF